jgi:hypothetical protein
VSISPIFVYVASLPMNYVVHMDTPNTISSYKPQRTPSYAVYPCSSKRATSWPRWLPAVTPRPVAWSPRRGLDLEEFVYVEMYFPGIVGYLRDIHHPYHSIESNTKYKVKWCLFDHHLPLSSNHCPPQGS